MISKILEKEKKSLNEKKVASRYLKIEIQGLYHTFYVCISKASFRQSSLKSLIISGTLYLDGSHHQKYYAALSKNLRVLASLGERRT